MHSIVRRLRQYLPDQRTTIGQPRFPKTVLDSSRYPTLTPGSSPCSELRSFPAKFTGPVLFSGMVGRFVALAFLYSVCVQWFVCERYCVYGDRIWRPLEIRKCNSSDFAVWKIVFAMRADNGIAFVNFANWVIQWNFRSVRNYYTLFSFWCVC